MNNDCTTANLPRLAIFARAPVPGQTKTRLIPHIGAERAALLHEAMTRHLVEQALAAAAGPVTLWCSPDCEHPFFAECRSRYDVALQRQGEGDLGARMLQVFEQAQGPAMIAGSDCPSITARDLTACADALRSGFDAVFLPAEDGGYGLIGLARPLPALFSDMPWGGPEVMTQTRARLREAGLRWHEERIIWDVDEPADYERLCACGLLAGWTA